MDSLLDPVLPHSMEKYEDDRTAVWICSLCGDEIFFDKWLVAQ